jgi:hypothetical protein
MSSVGHLLARKFNLQYLPHWKLTNEELDLWKLWITCFAVQERESSQDVLVYWQFLLEEMNVTLSKNGSKPRWKKANDASLITSFNLHYNPAVLPLHELLMWEPYDSDRLTPYLQQLQRTDWKFVEGPISLTIYQNQYKSSEFLYLFGDVHLFQKKGCSTHAESDESNTVHISNWLLQQVESQTSRGQLFLEAKVLQPGDEKQTFEGKSPDGHLFGITASLFRKELQSLEASSLHQVHQIDVRHMEWFRNLKGFAKLKHIVDQDDYFETSKYGSISRTERRSWWIALLLFFQGHTLLNHIDKHLPSSWDLKQQQYFFNRLFTRRFRPLFFNLMYVLINLVKIDRQLSALPTDSEKWKQVFEDEMDDVIEGMFSSMVRHPNPFSILLTLLQEAQSLDLCGAFSKKDQSRKKPAECWIYQWHLLLVDIYGFARWIRYRHDADRSFFYTGEYHSIRYRDWMSRWPDPKEWKLVYQQVERENGKKQCIVL